MCVCVVCTVCIFIYLYVLHTNLFMQVCTLYRSGFDFKIIPGITTGENEIMQWAKRQMYLVIKNQFSTPAPQLVPFIAYTCYVHVFATCDLRGCHHFFPLQNPLCFIVMFTVLSLIWLSVLSLMHFFYFHLFDWLPSVPHVFSMPSYLYALWSATPLPTPTPPPPLLRLSVGDVDVDADM